MRLLRLSCLSLLAVVLAVAPAAAQDGELVSSWTASRAQLERRLTSLEALTQSTAYSDRARTRAVAEVAIIRRRLSEGDFRIGDRVYVEIEAALTIGPNASTQNSIAEIRDTLTVLDGQRINIRTIGEVSLAGILRSELNQRVAAAVSEVLNNARATTRPLVRLAVLGSVARPGYYSIPMEYRIDDLLMLAGGPAPNTQTQSMKMFRGDTVVLDDNEVRNYISEGRVLGDIGIQQGDQLYIGRGAEPIGRQQTLQFVFFLITPIISTLVFRLLR